MGISLLSWESDFPTASLLSNCLSKYKILKVSREFTLPFEEEEKKHCHTSLLTNITFGSVS